MALNNNNSNDNIDNLDDHEKNIVLIFHVSPKMLQWIFHKNTLIFLSFLLDNALQIVYVVQSMCAWPLTSNNIDALEIYGP